MERTEIIELRKLFTTYKQDDSAAGLLCGCFINIEKDIKGKFSTKLFKLKINEARKYYALVKKVFSNDMPDVKLAGKGKESIGFLLEKLKDTELKTDQLNDVLYEKIAAVLPEGNFAVFLLNYSYDVPVKTKDKKKVDDASEEVYNFIVCAICPVKTLKSTLGYDPKKDKLGENPQQLAVENPVFGFVYPSFVDRSPDTAAAACLRTEKLDISKELLGTAAPEKEKTGKSKKTTAKEEKIQSEGMGPGTNAVSAPQIPSLDSENLNNDAHYVEERLIEDNTLTDKPDEAFAPSSPSKPIPPSEGKIRIPKNKKIQKKTIDGAEFYIVPVKDAVIV